LSEIILSAKNLKKYYPGVRAVDGVSIELRKGEVISILGPNGAGKTTTVEILEGLRKPDGGEIFYFNRPFRGTKEFKELIGVCLQENFFFEELTVLETLRMYSALYKKKVDLGEIIEIFELNEKLKSRVKNLSGGQKQRLALALAFVNDPEIVFLDEPTVGLDPHIRRHLWDIIRHYRQKGKTIILTTHYMEEAHQLSDRVYIMDHGKIIAHGTPQELITSSGLHSVVEVRKQNLEGLKLEEFENVIISGEYVYISAINIVPILEKLLEYDIHDFVVRQPTLEDVFLKLTGRKID